jgi:hypothetical protein
VKERENTLKRKKCYIPHPCSDDPNAISTKLCTVVDLIYIMFFANSIYYWLSDGHSAAVQSLLLTMTSTVGLTTGKHYNDVVTENSAEDNG